VIVEANIVTMFMAALIPGLMAVIFFLLTIAIYVAMRPEAGPAGEVVGPGGVPAGDAGGDPGPADLRMVIGGIYMAASSTRRRRRRWACSWSGSTWRGASCPSGRCARRCSETAQTTGMIYLILLGAEMLKIFMSRAGVPQVTAEWAVQSGLAPMTVLILLLVALILLGCLMDSLSMILLVIPFFWPVLSELNGGIYQGAEGAGFGMSTEDLKIWFGILALIVVELGLITPPVGMNVFVISALAKDTPMSDTFKGVMPFFGAELMRVAILIAFPAITLWLPSLL
jgi:TRAP-type C4-dicarboxylate transport system permease large subunit